MATTNYTGKEKRSNHTLETDKSESLLHFKIAEMTIRIAFIVLFYLAVIVVISKVGNSAYHFVYPIFGDESVEKAPGRDVKVTITDGESTDSIIYDLVSKNLILDAKSFSIRCKLSLNNKKTIQPGTYTLNTSQNYGEILDQLTNSEEIEE